MTSGRVGSFRKACNSTLEKINEQPIRAMALGISP
jgi:hypothetical protein